MSFQNKVVLLTGGTKGIGLAVAKHLSAQGALLALNYSSPSSDALATEILVPQLGGPDRCLAVRADVSTVSGIESLVDRTVARYGRVDVLVANAGAMPIRPSAAVTEDLFDRTYALNVKGPFFLAQKVVPHMPSLLAKGGGGGGGRIIFISTGIARNSAVPPPYALYASTKGAVEQLTRVLARDLGAGGRGITVNAVAPGPTDTEAFRVGKTEAMIETIAGQSPFGRLGTPEEIAEAIAFLAGEGGRWISGQILGVNGAAFV
ncbi:hypothetical protein F4778DRAFT_287100 [Xylariomycetidae sp. FL2044]|nr:hypothetical protein F4778DRAFT_287100 [Xylariomycetidae sp. FL2044]